MAVNMNKKQEHKVYRVVDVEVVGAYTVRVRFDDGEERVIDFRPVLEGPLYGPLRDETLFRQVQIDPEAHTLVWPNGADFDPETLHDWPKHADALIRMAQRWAKEETKRVGSKR